MHSTHLGLLCPWQCLNHVHFFESRTKSNDSDLFFFVLRQKFNHDTWIMRGGWSGIGMVTGGMDPTDFSVKWTHPTKIPTLTKYGGIVPNCQFTIPNQTKAYDGYHFALPCTLRVYSAPPYCKQSHTTVQCCSAAQYKPYHAVLHFTGTGFLT